MNTLILNTHEIMELRLCESTRIVLQPNRLYLFTVDETCARCKEVEAKGKPPVFPS